MKNTLIVSLLFIAGNLIAADTTPDKPAVAVKESYNYLEKLSVAAIAGFRNVDITGPTLFGAGLDVGLGVNKYVSLHVQNLAYARNDWRDSTVDETSLLVKADLVKYANESFRVYGIGGGVRDWNAYDWGFSAGLGLQYNFTKYIAIGIDSQIRAWFKQSKDVLTCARLSYSF